MSNFEHFDRIRFDQRLKLQGCTTGRFGSYTHNTRPTDSGPGKKVDTQSEQIEAQRKAKQIMRANESHYTN